MWIDVGKLIREHIPDKNGNPLPETLTSGSYEIRDLNNKIGTLFEGKVIYDTTYGHVTYGCGSCCGYKSSRIWYDPLGIAFQGTAGNGVNGLDSCSGLWEDVSDAMYGNWATASSSIATVDYYGVHTGQGVGSTTSSTHGLLQPNSIRINCPPEISFGGNGGDNVTPRILLGGPTGTDVTGKNTSVVVGQQIVLYASYSGVLANSWSWNVPGTIVGGFSTASNNGGPTPINLNSQQTTFYWVSTGGSQSVSYTVAFTLNYGSNQTATAQTTFNVSAPTSPIVTIPPTGAVQVAAGPILEFGDPASTPGVKFSGSVTPPLGYQNHILWIQVINKSNYAFLSAGGSCGEAGLDNGVPYSTSSTTSDSPAVSLPSDDNQVTWDFAATMFFMWRPGLQNDIPVPLGYATWQFHADVKQDPASHVWSTQSDSSGSLLTSLLPALTRLGRRRFQTHLCHPVRNEIRRWPTYAFRFWSALWS